MGPGLPPFPESHVSVSCHSHCQALSRMLKNCRIFPACQMLTGHSFMETDKRQEILESEVEETNKCQHTCAGPLSFLRGASDTFGIKLCISNKQTSCSFFLEQTDTYNHFVVFTYLVASDSLQKLLDQDKPCSLAHSSRACGDAQGHGRLTLPGHTTTNKTEPAKLWRISKFTLWRSNRYQ